MGWLQNILGKNSELEQMYDAELFEDVGARIHYRRLALQTCTNLIARTVSQSEFRIRRYEEDVKNQHRSMYYQLNVRPNKNQSASQFWHRVIQKLVEDNECLIVQNDSRDLLIADTFVRVESANYEDRFQGVAVKNYTFSRTFQASDVIYVQYANEDLSRLLNALFEDYGELLGKMLEVQKRRGQIRATVQTESLAGKTEDKQKTVQNFIDRAYQAFEKKLHPIIPQQKGMEYTEQSSGKEEPSFTSISDLQHDFLDHTARALGIPPSFARGEVADNESQVKNFMKFCVHPLLQKIEDEINAKSFSQNDFFNGLHVNILNVAHLDMFEVAGAIDKLRASGVANGHELRDKVGLPYSDDPLHNKFFITKNYENRNGESTEGGDSE